MSLLPTVKKARTLIGWLPPEEGARWLAGRLHSSVPDPTYLARCTEALKKVGQRSANIDQANCFRPLPNDVTNYLGSLQNHPRLVQTLAEGGAPKLVNLRQICAIQPTIHVEDALARINNIHTDNWLELAQITFPQDDSGRMPYIYDQVRHAWVLSSQNPNLRLLSPFNAEIKPGVHGFGFVVEIRPSFLQVAGVNGRYFLLDGYHRAYGLLASGIDWVPALVREYTNLADVKLTSGLLHPSTYMGERPPLLIDYLDPLVAADTTVPTTSKVILVQGLEMSPLG